jgi:thiamine-phosphate pyrophosphorylase
MNPLRGESWRSSDAYAITDRRLAGGRGHEEIVEALLRGGVRCIQVREKNLEAGGGNEGALGREAYCEVLARCRELAARAGAVLFVNDDPRLAAELDADGVHVGQEDIPPREARAIIGTHRLLGVSTHTRGQFLAALDEPVDYVAIGPVFGTTSKQSPFSALGLEFVAWAWGEARRRAMPLVPIGGITEENVGLLLDVAPGCLPAVIGAMMTPGDIAGAARRFLEAVRRARAAGTRKEQP